VHAFEYFGGIPALAVPDNTKTGVTNAHRYDPDLNPTYYNFALHCGFGIVPVRPYKPRDKAKVENAVQVAQRWIVAALRHRKFFMLEDLNQAIGELLTKLNHRPFRKASPGTTPPAADSFFFCLSSGRSNGGVFPNDLSHCRAECKASINIRSSRNAESATKGDPSENSAQIVWSVIQIGKARALPCGVSQTNQSPSSRCIRRRIGRLCSNRLHHR